MKKVLCSFVFGLMLMVSGAQAWADYPIPNPPPNPRLVDSFAIPTLSAVQAWGEYPIPNPPPDPKVAEILQSR